MKFVEVAVFEDGRVVINSSEPLSFLDELKELGVEIVAEYEGLCG